MSRIYDLLAGSSEFRFVRYGIEALAIKPGETALEIGCGTGKALVELHRHVGYDGALFGLDLSPGMLQKTFQRLARARIGNQVSIQNGDGLNLPYKCEAFSAVYMSFTLELFDAQEMPQVLAESWRVLKSAGRLGVVAMSIPLQPGRIDRLYAWFHKRFPNYVDCRPIHAQNLIQAAGFIVEKQYLQSMWGLPVIILVSVKP